MPKPKPRKAKDPKAARRAQPKTGELAEEALDQVSGGSGVSDALRAIANAQATAGRGG
jgi:hypothetical protein